jgi:hypothetical protein
MGVFTPGWLGRLAPPVRYIQPVITTSDSAHARTKLRSIAYSIGDRIVTASPEWMTSSNPPDGEPRPSRKAKFLNRFRRVV